MMERKMWGEKPYFSFDYYLKSTFHEKVYKLTLNGGMTCPNRDGRVGTGGCIFCSVGGSGEFAAPAELSIPGQLAFAKKNLSSRIHAKKYIAYFQAYTNTYAPVDYLERIFTQAIEDEDVCVLSIATRPDCLGEDVLELLGRLAKRKPVWVELGLQTSKPESVGYIRRGYENEVFETAVRNLRKNGVDVIVHVILGLPGEDREDMLQTVEYVNSFDVQGIKLQLLHVLSGTDLAKEHAAGKFRVFTQDEYVTLVGDCIAHLRPEIVVHRVTGDGPSAQLIAPMWSTAKMTVLNEIHHSLKERGIYQGCKLQESERRNV